MKIVNIVGARPQFIKLVPVLKTIAKYDKENLRKPIQEILIHTGQHYDYQMSDVFFDQLGIKSPDYHLGVGSGSHGYQTAEMLKRIEEVLLGEKPDVVVVYGDTNSTLAGALAAAKLHIPVAHVEAGLRSFNKQIPEEINRVLTDHVSSLLFCPTETAVKNLIQEGFKNVMNEGKLVPLEKLKSMDYKSNPLVINVGDVMYDAMLLYSTLAEKQSKILERLHIKPKDYFLATIHRAENTDDSKNLSRIFKALTIIAKKGITVVIPLHPRTRKVLNSISLELEIPSSLLIIEPVSYLDMILLEKNARVILTDSGGVQKEAFFLKVPCVTLRQETEWVETLETGWNILVGSDTDRIVQEALEAKPGYESVFPYGDGKASERIVEVLRICIERKHVQANLNWQNKFSRF